MTEDTVQIVVFILIGVGWAAVSVIKKVDKWIQENRLPRGKSGGQTAQTASSRPRTFAEQTVQNRADAAQERERPREARRSLLEEIANAFEGLDSPQQEKQPEPVPASPPEKAARRSPDPEQPYQRPSTRQPASATARPSARSQAAPVADSVKADEKTKGLGSGISGRRPKGPLQTTVLATSGATLDTRALLRSPADVRRGIIVHEILGKPKALREGPLADPPELQLRMD